MLRTLIVKSCNFSTRKNYGSEFATIALWSGQTSLAQGTSYFNELYQENSCHCLKEHCSNCSLLKSWWWRGKSLYSCPWEPQFPPGKCRQSSSLKLTWNAAESSLATVTLPCVTDLWEPRLAGLYMLHEFHGYQLGRRVFNDFLKNQRATGLLFERWHIPIKIKLSVKLAVRPQASYAGISQTRFLYL